MSDGALSTKRVCEINRAFNLSKIKNRIMEEERRMSIWLRKVTIMSVQT
jgi:hypothetical protein